MISTEPRLDGVAIMLRRGVMRWLVDLGYQPLAEFTLRTGRRIDVFGLDERGDTVAIEIKSSLADFRTDMKWRDYLGFCDRFYFAVGADFPVDRLPDDTGILVADGFGADIYCESVRSVIASARRRSLILRFACASASRLYRTEAQPPELRADRLLFG
ncbi:MAG: MmcB family DNA repair protein [Alphaproteobacteria bacterium]